MKTVKRRLDKGKRSAREGRHRQQQRRSRRQKMGKEMISLCLWNRYLLCANTFSKRILLGLRLCMCVLCVCLCGCRCCWFVFFSVKYKYGNVRYKLVKRRPHHIRLVRRFAGGCVSYSNPATKSRCIFVTQKVHAQMSTVAVFGAFVSFAIAFNFLCGAIVHFFPSSMGSFSRVRAMSFAFFFISLLIFANDDLNAARRASVHCISIAIFRTLIAISMLININLCGGWLLRRNLSSWHSLWRWAKIHFRPFNIVENIVKLCVHCYAIKPVAKMIRNSDANIKQEWRRNRTKNAAYGQIATNGQCGAMKCA